MLFDLNIDVASSSSVSKAKFPVPSDFKKGVLAKLVGYEFSDEKATLTFQAENGGQTKKTLYDPSKGEKVNEQNVVQNVKALKSLALNLGLVLPTGQVNTWKEVCDGYFNQDFTDNEVRLKVGYASQSQPYDPSKFEGKTQEEIKSLYHPFINVSRQTWFFKGVNDTSDFTFNQYDKVYTDFELVETLPSSSDDLPFDEVKLPDLDFTASDTPDVIF